MTTDKILMRLRRFTLLESSLCFVVTILLILTVSMTFSSLDQQQLNYELLKQRQSDLQQLIKDHPDQWWYKSDLNMTNSLLEMFSKT